MTRSAAHAWMKIRVLAPASPSPSPNFVGGHIDDGFSTGKTIRASGEPLPGLRKSELAL
eukprot:CAMPEP_0180200764 /NCGR_PEP_ID=MMETSP0987-20121128/6399_1 /TAXON_ID=697907 /ORGANISM="non described non described, Strain CCMP2293" /LENGTH=58 /DNA_ID=CAMNT_0022155903 /DNA_START=58 /DNA_END=234 /DNA_ORIENTATION=+